MTAANEGTLATVAPQIISPGFVLRDLNDALPGVVRSAGFMQTLRSAMPDLRLTAEDIFGAGDRVVVRYRITGTHNAEVFGISPTDRRVDFNGIFIYRFEQEKIAETWQLPDVWGFMSQVGAVKGAGEGAA